MSQPQDAAAPAPVSAKAPLARGGPPVPWTRRVGRTVEAALTRLGLALSDALPLDTASATGGWLARVIGPRLGVTNRARRNLKRVFPSLTDAQVEKIVRAMWDNLGRTVVEYPHLVELARRAELVGEEHVNRALARGKPLIFVTAHVGNWELGPAIAAQFGVPLNLIYRPVNNPAVDRIVRRYRNRVGIAGLVPRGREGVPRTLELLAAGQHLGMILDQKVSRGLAMSFLGQAAMVPRSLAHLALRFDCAVLAAQVERLEGARLRLTVHPIDVAAYPDRGENMRAIMTNLNATMEAWIRHRPEQWLWLHRRWRD
jgi:KDO2-lipid IV(A) lauroyltransferase